jgi:hypothetical protein
MTRGTKSNIVVQSPTVFPVNVSPLYYFRFFAVMITFCAYRGLSFVSSYPLVQTPVAYLLSLPFRMSRVFQKSSKFSVMFWRVLRVSSYIPMFLSVLSKFCYERFLVTKHVAVVSGSNFRRRSGNFSAALITMNSYHIATI